MTLPILCYGCELCKTTLKQEEKLKDVLNLSDRLHDYKQSTLRKKCFKTNQTNIGVQWQFTDWSLICSTEHCKVQNHEWESIKNA